MHQTTTNAGERWSATTLTVLDCLAAGLDLKTANYIASLGATITTNNKEIRHVSVPA